jgi:3-hydroxy-9,10-secoandrosta-1,3,5(10)-triene-9,17-dione monooxygenase reductase component
VRHLDDDDYFVLNVLSAGTPRSLAEIDALMAYGGRSVDAERIAALTRRALVQPGAHPSAQPNTQPNGASPRIAISDAGRQVMLEMAAVSKAAEEDALQQIDYSETHLLRNLLKRLIRNTAQGVPALWPARPERTTDAALPARP